MGSARRFFETEHREISLTGDAATLWKKGSSMKALRSLVLLVGSAASLFVLLLLVRSSRSIAGGGGAPLLDERYCADPNGDGSFDVSDPIFLLQNLFVGGPDPHCVAQGLSLDDLFAAKTAVEQLTRRVESVESAVESLPLAPEEVNVVPGATPSESGLALLDALASIDDASEENPYTIKLAPGIYDLGSESLVLKEHVDIEGSGEFTTKITACGRRTLDGGTVVGSNDAELRFLTVENRGRGLLDGPTCEDADYAIALYCEAASPRLIHVRLVALQEQGGGAVFAVGCFATGTISGPRMRSVSVIARGEPNSLNYAIWARNIAVSPPIENSIISATSGTRAQGIRAESASLRFRGVQVFGETRAIRALNPVAGEHRLTFRQSRIETPPGGVGFESVEGVTVELIESELIASIDIEGDGLLLRRRASFEDHETDEESYRVDARDGIRFDVGEDDWVLIERRTRRTILDPFVPVLIDTSTGAYLTRGGAWTNASSREAKENFETEDPRCVLEKLVSIPIESWNYKTEGEEIRHLGPMAEEFHEVFGTGGDPGAISTVDADGVALAAIQGLHSLVLEERARAEALEASLEEARESLRGLSKRIEALEGAVPQPEKNDP